MNGIRFRYAPLDNQRVTAKPCNSFFYLQQKFAPRRCISFLSLKVIGTNMYCFSLLPSRKLHFFRDGLLKEEKPNFDYTNLFPSYFLDVVDH